MKSLSKTRAILSKATNFNRGIVAFWVHPEDMLIFKTKLDALNKPTKSDKTKELWKLVLSVSKFYSARTLKQNSTYRGIVHRICTDPDSEAFGSDPDNLHEGILARGALSYNYPTVLTVAGVRVPDRSHCLDTKNMNLLIEVATVIAGECKVDLSDMHLGEDNE